jgi:predicted lipoprotein
MTIPRRFALALLALAALPACKILPTEQAAKQEGVDTFFDDKSFDPDKMVREMWDAKVIPYLTAKAGAFPAVRDLARSNADEAGKTYGFRQKEGNSPWTLVTRIDGKIIAANTTSRAGTIDVDADGDGKADLTVQIGPAMRGTALRDSLDFISFNTFTNQIDFAKFGKAFNQHVDKTMLSALPRDGLIGRQVSVLGAFPLDKGSALPLVTPAAVTLGPAS